MAKPVDIHTHLADESYRNTLLYLKTYLKYSDIILVSVSVDIKTSIENIKWKEEFPDKVIPFVGIHPQMADQADMSKFQAYLMKVKDFAIGLGEIGLDRRMGSMQDLNEVQKKVFTMQLEFAERLRKPVSIHTRGTLNETFEILSSYHARSVLLHWFAGDEDDLKNVIDRGYYASFGPAMVYSKRKRLLVASMPPEFILTETDGPVRFGGCFGGRTAYPTFLHSVLFELASVLHMSYDNVLSMIHSNSERYLGLDL